LQSLVRNGLDPTFVTEAVAIAIGGPAGAVALQVQELVLASGGSLAGLSPNDKNAIFQSTVGALAATAPYETSDNPALSSPASEIAARVRAIQNIMTDAAPPVTVIHTINPNLMVLSAQYYGDATKWRTIANANGLADPQPVGSYNLTIPQSA
jgi:nucleoid-associated protein YgaU